MNEWMNTNTNTNKNSSALMISKNTAIINRPKNVLNCNFIIINTDENIF